VQHKKARRQPKLTIRLALTKTKPKIDKQAQEFELEGFFRLSLDLLSITGEDGYWQRVNPAWEDLLGYSSQELLATPQIDFVHHDDQSITLAELAKLANGTATTQFQNRYRCKNGSYRSLAWIVTICPSSQRLYATAREIQQPQTEAKLGTIEAIYQLVAEAVQAESEDWKKQQTQQLKLALSHSEKRYQALIEVTRQMIWHTNSKGEFLRQQPTWSAFTGQTDDELQGCGWLQAVHPDDKARTLQVWLEAVAKGSLYQIEHRLRRYNGEYHDMSVRAVPVKDADGEIREWVGIETDITKYKQAECALIQNGEMFCFLLEHTPAAIAMFDKEMKYQLVSRRFLENYHLDYPNILGKTHYEVFPQLPAHWQEIHQRCLQGASEQCEEDLFVGVNGQQHWEKWEIRPWTNSNGEISGIILVTEVITEQRQAKEQLRQLNQKLLQSNRDLEQFAYVASHDLQEPLRAVISYAQLFARKYQGNLDAQADKYIHYVVAGAAQMQQLIEDLLDFSRIGTHGKELQPIALEIILAQVCHNLKVAIAQSQVLVTQEPLPIVMGDQTQLIQLFQNLIANAIKFRKSETPKVQIKAIQQANQWLISVSDNGIGIGAEYFERIFIIFQRLHSRREYPGTGIGLAVCQKIVERHGGDIWLESTLGVGTTFYFRLAVSQSENHDYSDKK
jgi:PAS domain S-box-containing protein